MSKVSHFFRCVSQAIAVQGFKGLIKIVPLGEQLIDIASDAMKRFRDHQEVRDGIDAVTHATTEEIQIQAKQVAAEVTNDPQEQEALELYLIQIPRTILQTLHQAQYSTESALPTLELATPEDFAQILPIRGSRFRPGQKLDIIGNWVLKELLGAGGFGEVWRAHHPSLPNTEAAFKFCLDPSTLQKNFLKNEATVINQVMSSKHPGIVPLIDANLDCDPPWIRYEFVTGGVLTRVIRDWQKITDNQRVVPATEMLCRLAKIVGHFHSMDPSVIHRDLKPANILIDVVETDRSSQEIRPRIADFGISKVAAKCGLDQSRHTTGRSDIGALLRGAHTPLYASPQQRRGKEPDVRDDVYSLGVIWYQMLIADPGAERPGGQGWRKRLETMGLSNDQIGLLDRCWDDDPNTRPMNAKVLAEAVQQQFGEKLRVTITIDEKVSRPILPPTETIQAGVSTDKPPSTIQQPPPRVPKPKRTGQRISLSLPSIKKSGMFGLRSTAMPIELDLAWIPPGTYQMGSPETESRRGEDEKLHIVTLTKGFFLGIFPVTVGQFRSFTQNGNYQTIAERFGGAYSWDGKSWKQNTRTNWQNPGFSQTDLHPVTCVTTLDAENFCKWLTKECGQTVRLPTEAEWEYACRAGTTTPFSFGETISVAQANFNGNFVYGKGVKGIFRAQTTPMGTFPPNAWGLCDMHGNVWEWCADEYGPYSTEGAMDPFGRYFDESRILRGGSWLQGPANCRAANRISQEADDYIEKNKPSESQKKAEREKGGSDRCSMVGFRIAMIPEE